MDLENLSEENIYKINLGFYIKSPETSRCNLKLLYKEDSEKLFDTLVYHFGINDNTIPILTEYFIYEFIEIFNINTINNFNETNQKIILLNYVYYNIDFPNIRELILKLFKIINNESLKLFYPYFKQRNMTLNDSKLKIKNYTENIIYISNLLKEGFININSIKINFDKIKDPKKILNVSINLSNYNIDLIHKYSNTILQLCNTEDYVILEEILELFIKNNIKIDNCNLCELEYINKRCFTIIMDYLFKLNIELDFNLDKKVTIDKFFCYLKYLDHFNKSEKEYINLLINSDANTLNKILFSKINLKKFNLNLINTTDLSENYYYEFVNKKIQQNGRNIKSARF